jgi:hypothetical protein
LVFTNKYKANITQLTMIAHQFNAGPIEIHMPDENQNYFSIFHDLAELFGTEYQKDAFRLLRDQLREVRPKPNMDYEADFTHITTSSVDTIVAVIVAISKLVTEDHKAAFPELNIAEIKEIFTRAKKNRPKPKPWQTGDVFAIPLLNKTFAFGQVLDQDHCTCVLFDAKSEVPLLEIGMIGSLQPVTIMHLGRGDLLNNGYWQVLFNHPASFDPASGFGGRWGTVGCTSFGSCEKMADLANAYWGLEPWNVMYEEDYYDKMLMKKLTRPKTALVLNEAERKRYRKEKFGID